MAQEWIIPAAVAGAAAVVTVALGIARIRYEKRRHAEQSGPALGPGTREYDADQLQLEFDAAESGSVAADDRASRGAPRAERAERAQRSDRTEYVITDLAREPETPPVPTLDGQLFADLLLRETVVKAAALVYGLRSALSAESRNRIRFEIRREVKRSRKQRKAETKVALREYRARQRDEMPGDLG